MNLGGSTDEPLALELPAGFVVVDLPIGSGEDAREVGRRAAAAAIAIVAPGSSLAYDGTRPMVAPSSSVPMPTAPSAEASAPSSSASTSASISITHTRGRAIAIAGRVARLGVDLVGDADAERIVRMSERYLTDHERSLATDELAAAQVFAAKEAGLKALGLGLLDGGAFDHAWAVRIVSLDPPRIASDGVELTLVLGRAGDATIAVVYAASGVAITVSCQQA